MIALLALLHCAAPGGAEAHSTLRARFDELDLELFRRPDAMDAAQGFLDDARALGEPDLIGLGQLLVSRVELHRGDADEALRLGLEAAAKCNQAGATWCEAESRNEVTKYYVRKGELLSALSQLERATTLFAEVDDDAMVAATRSNLAILRSELRDWSGAIRDMEAVRDAFASHEMLFEGLWHMNYAMYLVAAERYSEALAAAERAVEFVDVEHPKRRPDFGVQAWGTLAIVRRDTGDLDGALEAHERALQFPPETRPVLEVANHFQAAETLLKAGRPEEALGHIEPVLHLLPQLAAFGRAHDYHVASLVYEAVDEPKQAMHFAKLAFEAQKMALTDRGASLLSDATSRLIVLERETEAARLSSEKAAADAQLVRTRAVLGGSTALSTLIILGLYMIFSRRRSRAVIEERTRLAREIHDSLMQGTTAVLMNVDAAMKMARSGQSPEPRLEKALGVGREVLAEAREFVWQLRSTSTSNSVEDALRALVDRLDADPSVRIELQIEGPAQTLDNEAALALVRVAQEAIANALSHASADRIDVCLSSDGDRIRLTVRDDGQGFLAAAERAPISGHWGLQGMRERLQKVGGRLEISSAPGQGSTICAEIARNHSSVEPG